MVAGRGRTAYERIHKGVRRLLNLLRTRAKKKKEKDKPKSTVPP